MMRKIDNRLIFIVGVGRSGTSLVQSMLASHSEVAFPPETHFLRLYALKGVLSKVFQKQGMVTVTRLLATDDYIKRLGIDIRDVLLAFSREGLEFTDVALYELLLRRYADAMGKTRVGDKDPRSIEYLLFIWRHWPDAYVINVIRDPRDVLASKKKAAWSRGRPSIFHIFANQVQFKMGCQKGSELFGERYQEIIYEELISDPESVLKRTCSKLDLRFEPEMLKFSSTAKTLVAESEISWKKETLGPLMSENKGKWNTVLADWETVLTEVVCREAFEVGGYEKSDSVDELPGYKRVGIWLCSCLLRAMEWFYVKYRLWTQR